MAAPVGHLIIEFNSDIMIIYWQSYILQKSTSKLDICLQRYEQLNSCKNKWKQWVLFLLYLNVNIL